MVAEPIRRDEFEGLQGAILAALQDQTDHLIAQDGKLDALRGDMDGKIDTLRGDMDRQFAEVADRLDGQDRRLAAMDGKLDTIIDRLP